MNVKIAGHTSICVVVGDPIEFTLSPKMHNAAYRTLGIDDKFVFVCCEVNKEYTSKIADFARVMGVCGLAVANPHNTKIVQYLDEVDPVAELIGSVNTVVNRKNRLIGYNTDWVGAVTALELITTLDKKKVAILGAGGAARAIAFGLRERGSDISIFARDIKKASALARRVGAVSLTFEEIAGVADYDIIVNATPIGKSPFQNISLVPASCLNSDQVVMDAVYLPLKTRLLVEAEKIGAKIVPGMEMLLHQGAAQFEIHTDCKAPLDAMRSSLLNIFQAV
ncbi:MULTISPECIES: shikimate dehydrogenase [Delftia]|uniref:shikimate dehydrogenase n=1 Tax=Delftia TaxID=80865 RepID=UPI000447C8E9|nr:MULTISPECIES: shikimate dehydrogenase [Delftia]EZP56037.1 Shikimate dehydrogenase [Delftia sp. RIT313]SOE35596.1 shikimate dehydrogenase [Delftia acidovorans]